MTTTEQTEAIRTQVRAYLTEELATPVADDLNIFGAGLANSLFTIQLVTYVERAFGVQVGTDELDEVHFCSVDAITAFVAAKPSRSAAA
ncbi:acyl carrier protein [Streptomyces sp. NPDC057249]|uniref:acyl carrier protein n=2 Tax=unclassified Streptomyces TaxID=2593676 RepID=UPI0036283CE6